MVMLCLVQSGIYSNRTIKAKGCRKMFVNFTALLIKCGRQDLLNKSIGVLAKYYHVCLNHSSKNMFSSANKSQLLPKAVPTEFEECYNVSVEKIGLDISTVDNNCLDETVFDLSVVRILPPSKENRLISVTYGSNKNNNNSAYIKKYSQPQLHKKTIVKPV
eukprot:XP_016665158.1 PREDICTED: uncharacterized protein LOC107885904 isoform X2 [Acyrthosiphon pisum]